MCGWCGVGVCVCGEQIWPRGAGKRQACAGPTWWRRVGQVRDKTVATSRDGEGRGGDCRGDELKGTRVRVVIEGPVARGARPAIGRRAGGADGLSGMPDAPPADPDGRGHAGAGQRGQIVRALAAPTSRPSPPSLKAASKRLLHLRRMTTRPLTGRCDRRGWRDGV